MMESISIGVLQPLSSIMPLSKDFENGLKDGFNSVEGCPAFELVKEYIGSGDTASVEKALNKLLIFDNVDLITGIVSNKVVENLVSKFEDPNRVLLVNNLGGHVPNVSKLNSQILISSAHLWRHAYALGYWGVKTFGKKGMFLGAVYDAGYSFSHMFYEGMKAANADSEWSFSVPPMRQPKQPTDMGVMFPYLEEYQPDFVFAAFCGGETTQFLNEMINRGWHKRTKILGLPYLMEPFKSLNDNLTVYTTAPLAHCPQVTAKSMFYHLGFQSGEAIAKAALSSGGTDLALQVANNSDVFSLRGNIPEDVKIEIVQHDVLAGEASFTSKNIAVCDAFPLDIAQMKPLTEGIITGWLNPYLCV